MWDIPFHMYTEASRISAGYLKAQGHGPTAYGSKKFNSMESKYKSYELEA